MRKRKMNRNVNSFHKLLKKNKKTIEQKVYTFYNDNRKYVIKASCESEAFQKFETMEKINY